MRESIEVLEYSNNIIINREWVFDLGLVLDHKLLSQALISRRSSGRGRSNTGRDYWNGRDHWNATILGPGTIVYVF